jgi:hypothetical protein
LSYVYELYGFVDFLHVTPIPLNKYNRIM